MNNREILITWLNEANAMKAGEELYLPCESKETQKDLFKYFKKEIQILEKVDPKSASSLFLGKNFKDHRFWVFIRKTAHSPLTAFKKEANGNTKRLDLEINSEKKRRLRLMKEDGLSLTDTKEIESLTKEDIEYWRSL